MNLKQTLKTVAILTLVAVMGGCKKDDTGNTNESGYLLLFRTSTDPTADYLLTAKDLMTGSISATGTGMELTGYNYHGRAGSTFFTIDYDNNVCVGFEVNGGQISEKGRFAYERMDCMTQVDENTMIAIGAPWGGGSFDCQIQVVSAQDVSIHRNVKTPVYISHDTTGAQLNAWPTGSYVQGNKFFISFYPLNGASWETPLTDTAYVSVYSYPDLVYQHTFKDTRTGPIGFYGDSPVMLEDESGNHYALSSSSLAAGFTQSTKPSGILKINAGTEAFDAGYFFDVEAHGYRVLTGAYVGNGKIVARVISNAYDQSAEAWAVFSLTNAICNMAVLDLNAQTITIVNDVPLHGGQYVTPFFVEDGKVYASITTSASDAFIYQIDPASATAIKGARIEGSEIQSFFKY